MPVNTQISPSDGVLDARAMAAPGLKAWKFDPSEWDVAAPDPGLSRWQVLHTRSRQEKAVAELLDSTGVEVFLPLIRKVRYYGHRQRVAELPLFPSYVFVWGPHDSIFPAIASKRAVGAVRTSDQERLDRELLHLKLALEGKADLDPYPFLEEGRPVRVTAGPFKGIEGLVEERRSPDRLVLQIHTLGRATALEIDPSILEPLD